MSWLGSNMLVGGTSSAGRDYAQDRVRPVNPVEMVPGGMNSISRLSTWMCGAKPFWLCAVLKKRIASSKAAPSYGDLDELF